MKFMGRKFSDEDREAWIAEMKNSDEEFLVWVLGRERWPDKVRQIAWDELKRRRKEHLVPQKQRMP
jgi:succinate dehydrogenase flavin-adding protein (antitoxin of CptAB toxin-antitoxin module)